MHSHQKVINELRVLRDVSVDHCRNGMIEVECCYGQVNSEADNRERASEQGELDQAKRAPRKVLL